MSFNKCTQCKKINHRNIILYIYSSDLNFDTISSTTYGFYANHLPGLRLHHPHQTTSSQWRLPQLQKFQKTFSAITSIINKLPFSYDIWTTWVVSPVGWCVSTLHIITFLHIKKVYSAFKMHSWFKDVQSTIFVNYRKPSLWSQITSTSHAFWQLHYLTLS